MGEENNMQLRLCKRCNQMTNHQKVIHIPGGIIWECLKCMKIKTKTNKK